MAILFSVDCLHSSFRSHFVNGFFRKLLLFDVNVTFIKMSIHNLNVSDLHPNVWRRMEEKSASFRQGKITQIV